MKDNPPKDSSISVSVIVEKPLEKVWEKWISEEDVKNWNIPFDDWHCPLVKNNVETGGDFFFRMESKDGKEGFDYKGKYTRVVPLEIIENRQEDGRKTINEFQEIDENTIIRETFEPENHTPVEQQKKFCEAVLKRFKTYVES